MQKYSNLDSSATDYADNEAYKRLIELGEGAIAYVMLDCKTPTNQQ